MDQAQVATPTTPATPATHITPATPATPATSISLVVTPPTDISKPGKSSLDTNKFVWTPASLVSPEISANTGTDTVDTLQVDSPRPMLVDSSSCQNLISIYWFILANIINKHYCIDIITSEHPLWLRKKALSFSLELLVQTNINGLLQLEFEIVFVLQK